MGQSKIQKSISNPLFLHFHMPKVENHLWKKEKLSFVLSSSTFVVQNVHYVSSPTFFLKNYGRVDSMFNMCKEKLLVLVLHKTFKWMNDVSSNFYKALHFSHIFMNQRLFILWRSFLKRSKKPFKGMFMEALVEDKKVCFLLYIYFNYFEALFKH